MFFSTINLLPCTKSRYIWAINWFLITIQFSGRNYFDFGNFSMRKFLYLVSCLENCQKFYSSTPAIKCVKYLLPVLIFKSKTASQGGLSFFSFHPMRNKFRGIKYNIGHNLKSVEKRDKIYSNVCSFHVLARGHRRLGSTIKYVSQWRGG